MGKKNFIFTNKSHPKQGIMALILGIIAVATLIAVIYFSYRSHGQTSLPSAAAASLALIYAFVGLTLGIYALRQKDNYKIFPVLGILFNASAIGIVSMILYAGAYLF